MAVTTSAMRTLSASIESQAGSTTGADDEMPDESMSDIAHLSSDDGVMQDLKIRAKQPRRTPAKATPKAASKATPKSSVASKPKPTITVTRRRNSSHNYTPSASSGHSTPRSASSRKSTGSPLGRVETGRVAKTYKSKQLSSSPRIKDRRPRNGDDDDELVSELNQQVQISEAKAEEEMELEKLFFPGSDQWAPDENRLFEALYLRQFRPLVPSSWTFDFRGIPAPDAVFASSDEQRPLIYSCTGHDAQASRALIRLIQLNGTVRALVQSGNQAKCAATIRAELYRYANWAAKDGGFDRYKVLPTFLLEIADTSVNGGEITRYMQARMLALAKAHRDFLRLDQDDDDKEEEVLKSVEHGADAPTAKPGPRYHRPPPVLYGLFIIHTVVIILTVDSAKEPEAAEVSYHVEVNFNSPYQGLWNAFTVAIPVCMARDDMMQRKDDFELCLPLSESDPDA